MKALKEITLLIQFCIDFVDPLVQYLIILDPPPEVFVHPEFDVWQNYLG